AEGAPLPAVRDLVAGQVVVRHGGDVEVAAAQDRDGEGEVLRGGAVVQAQAAGASADGDPVPAQLHGVRVDALVGVLGDEHVVLALGDERAQHLPLGGAQVLSLVDEDVVGEPFSRHSGLRIQQSGGDGGGLVPVQGGVPLPALAVGGDHGPHLAALGAAQPGAAAGAGGAPVLRVLHEPVGQHDLAVLVDQELGGDVRLGAAAERAGRGRSCNGCCPVVGTAGERGAAGGPAEHVGHRGEVLGGGDDAVRDPVHAGDVDAGGAERVRARDAGREGADLLGEGVGEGAREGGQHDACRNLTLRGLAGEAHGAVDEDHGLAGAGAA